eukprot:5775373-Amphidinium_carterae.1
MARTSSGQAYRRRALSWVMNGGGSVGLWKSSLHKCRRSITSWVVLRMAMSSEMRAAYGERSQARRGSA